MLQSFEVGYPGQRQRESNKVLVPLISFKLQISCPLMSCHITKAVLAKSPNVCEEKFRFTLEKYM